MKIIVLGGRGMLGHKIVQQFQPNFDCWATIRQSAASVKNHPLFVNNEKIIGEVDASDFTSVQAAIESLNPDVIINCIGIIKQLKEAKDPLISIEINSMLPHKLAKLCRQSGKRLITISTDCVFSGLKGNYTETDNPDPVDLYGRSKLLGEVDDGHNLTLRTSIIGRELQTTSGLIEWFYSQQGRSIKGFSQAIYSGVTTLTLAKLIEQIISDHPDLKGLYQVASEPINKYDLLCQVRDQAQLDIHITKDKTFKIDRSLNGDRFKADSGIQIPSWEKMINEMILDNTPYDEWRQ